MSATLESPSAQPLWFLHSLAYVHVHSEQTAGAYTLGETVARRGEMPPLHVHHRDDEAFYVLDGELTLFVSDRQITLSKGNAALDPRGVPHAFRVESETARWLVINNPGGFERFVRAMSDPAERDEIPPHERVVDPAALTRAAADAGIEILGPPGTLPEQQP